MGERLEAEKEERDWIGFCLSAIGTEVERMRDECRNTARFIAGLDPYPKGATVVAVKLLRAAGGNNLASANREYRAMRAEARRRGLAVITPSRSGG